MSSNTAAVVVTYNRKALLKENINHLLSQKPEVPHIIIIDNHSTDGTYEFILRYIKDGIIEYHNTGENLGGAGGFSFGIKLAVSRGYQYIWLMDDDCMPQEDSLKCFFEADRALSGNYGFLSSRVLWSDGSLCKMNRQKTSLIHSITNYKHPVQPVIMASFVSLFLPQKTVLDFGLPIKEFFIWTDDWEYTRRISKKISCYAVPDSVVIHKSKNNLGADISSADPYLLDRFRYLYRNDVYLYRREGIKGLLYEIFRLTWHCIKIIFFCKDSRKKRLSVIFKGTWAGIHFRPDIEYIEKKD